MLIHDVTAEEAPVELAVVDLRAAIRSRCRSAAPFVLIVSAGANCVRGVVATEHVDQDLVGVILPREIAVKGIN